VDKFDKFGKCQFALLPLTTIEHSVVSRLGTVPALSPPTRPAIVSRNLTRDMKTRKAQPYRLQNMTETRSITPRIKHEINDPRNKMLS
jgi:hypothetical protein